MKLGQLVEYKLRKNFSFKNHAEDKAERLVSGYFWFFIKSLYKVKSSGLHLNLNIFR